MGKIMWKINETYDWSYLKSKFDWIQDMEGVPQSPIFHAEGDVEIHTQMVLKELMNLSEFQALKEQNQHVLVATALLHDIEKRSKTSIDSDGQITSRGHAKKGEYTARQILYKDVPTPFLIKESVAKLVRYHGLPLWIFEKPNPRKYLLQTSLEVNTKLLAIFAKADVLGRICSDKEELLYKIEMFKEYCKEQNCWGSPRVFPSNLAKFNYFSKEDASPDYEPFDNLKSEVILLSGLPGSGKDTFIKKHYPEWPIVSLDALRRKYKIAPSDKKRTGQIAQMVKEEARIHLRKGENFVWNATNITRQMRTQLVDLFTTYNARVKLVYIEVPYEKLMAQNSNRAYPVPNVILDKMIRKLEVPSPIEAHEVIYLNDY